MGNRQIIDLRDKEGDLGRNLKAVTDLITTLGDAESERQRQAQIQQLSQLLAGGSDIAGAGATIGQTPPAAPTGGISGILQRIASPFAAKPNVAEMLTNMAVKQKLDEPTGLERDLLKSRIAATDALANRRGTGQNITATGQKKIDSQNILILNKPDASDQQVARALEGLKQSPQITDILVRNEEVDKVFEKAVGGLDKALRTDSKRYGEVAYKAAVKNVLKEVASQKFNPDSIVSAFNTWWDEQFTTQKNISGPGINREVDDRNTFNIDFSDIEDSQAGGQSRKVGEVIEVGGRKFEITGFDTDGEPLVDEI